MKVYDINLKKNDLVIYNGDFVISESEQQEANLIINTFTANWFQSPLVGVGIINFLASPFISPLPLENLIINQLQADGFIVDSVSVKGTTIENINLNIQANR